MHEMLFDMGLYEIVVWMTSPLLSSHAYLNFVKNRQSLHVLVGFFTDWICTVRGNHVFLALIGLEILG